MEVFSDPQNVDSLALKDAVTGRPNKSEQSVHTSPWHTLELCPHTATPNTQVCRLTASQVRPNSKKKARLDLISTQKAQKSQIACDFSLLVKIFCHFKVRLVLKKDNLVPGYQIR
jgi:hypothetical protein